MTYFHATNAELVLIGQPRVIEPGLPGCRRVYVQTVYCYDEQASCTAQITYGSYSAADLPQATVHDVDEGPSAPRRKARRILLGEQGGRAA